MIAVRGWMTLFVREQIIVQITAQKTQRNKSRRDINVVIPPTYINTGAIILSRHFFLRLTCVSDSRARDVSIIRWIMNQENNAWTNEKSTHVLYIMGWLLKHSLILILGEMGFLGRGWEIEERRRWIRKPLFYVPFNTNFRYLRSALIVNPPQTVHFERNAVLSPA